MTFVAELEPKELWRHFDQILTIPRGSGNEAAIREYIVDVAKRRSLDYVQDAAGNLVVRRPARTGLEKAGGVVLQCHLDMVNEKNSNIRHDFTKDPIVPRQQGDYLKADGTTLGADNGIGIAAVLALLESDSLTHGPLEGLFTVDEETGLTGASNLSSDSLQGRFLINLDSEEEGALYVGCAGGAGIDLLLPLQRQNLRESATAISVRIGGLSGGHSGIDIHLQRGNAISILARCLITLLSEHDLRLVQFKGGNMHNAIPRESEALLMVQESQVEKIEKDLTDIFRMVAAEFKRTDAGMSLKLSSTHTSQPALDRESTEKTLSLLNALPHGVIVMSNDIPGLVETSSNLATASLEENRLLIHVSNRSSVESALRGIQQRVISIGQLAGAVAQWVEGYPGWQPHMESPLLKIVQSVHEETLGSVPESKAVHAGLECGIIKQKYPHMDVISFGPQIEYPHSPDEQVRISSVSGFFRLLVAVLKAIAQNQS